MPHDHRPPASSRPAGAGNWRLLAGTAALGLSIAGPLVLLPVVASLSLAAGTKAAISAVVVGLGEASGLAGVAIMGKPGYDFLRGRLRALLRRYGPPQTVSRRRYRLGLVLVLLPLALGWATPYVRALQPELPLQALWVAFAGDALFVIGLFVLGGAFWDKLRALLVHDATAVFPEDRAREG